MGFYDGGGPHSCGPRGLPWESKSTMFSLDAGSVAESYALANAQCNAEARAKQKAIDIGVEIARQSKKGGKEALDIIAALEAKLNTANKADKVVLKKQIFELQKKFFHDTCTASYLMDGIILSERVRKYVEKEIAEEDEEE